MGVASSPIVDLKRLTNDGSALRLAGEYSRAASIFAQIADVTPADWLAQFNAAAVLFEAHNLDASLERLARSISLRPTVAAHNLSGHVFALQGNMGEARRAYERAIALQPTNYDANWGIFEVAQLLDDNSSALHHQRIALNERSLRSIAASVQPARTTILELCIAGTFQANIPLDFVLDPERTTVHKLYLGEHPVPELPPYDIIFNTIADAPNAGPALLAAQALIAGQERPSLNAPHVVPQTSRDAVARAFADSRSVAVARTVAVNRLTVHAALLPYPFLIRPLDSHAGNDLARIDDGDALHAYLDATRHADDFYLSEFIDYRNADGLYRKYRIVFVHGVPYPVHLAISPRWMIHYYNAPMAENAWMREEEHAFMRDMSVVFDGIRAAGLDEIARTIPLEYFGIDCSIAPDGRVLLFEASTAMIVHMRDPIDLYPYKAQYVPRVINALERLIDSRLQRIPSIG